MTKRPFAGLCTVVLAVGCGGSGLSRSKAADLIKNSSTLKRQNVLNIYPSVGSENNSALLQGGYAVFEKVDGGSRFTLTEKGRALIPSWKDCSQFALPCMAFPTADKEFIEVTGIKVDKESQAEAEFSWQWKPNEAGKFFKMSNTNPHSCTVLLQHFDDGWRVTERALGDC